MTFNQDTPTIESGASSRRWTADRVVAVCLIIVQLGVLGYLSGAKAFPAFMMALTVWGGSARIRLQVDRTALSLVYAMTVIAFLLHYMFAPFPLPLDSQFIRSSLAHSIARFLITLQIMQLFLHHPNGYLPIWLSGCGAVALSFATNLRVTNVAQSNLLYLMAAFVVAFALYGGYSRRRVAGRSRSWLRIFVTVTALLIVSILGSGASWALQTHERNVEWFLAEYLGYGGPNSRAGFTPSGRLQSVTAWKTDGAERVMLRIFADDPPGYLRGKAFDFYQGSSRETRYTPWVSTFSRRPAGKPASGRNLPKLRPGDELYHLAPSMTSNERILDIWPDEHTEARLFTPLGASMVAVNGGLVQIDTHNIATIEDRTTSLPYIVYGPEQMGDVKGTSPQSAADVDRESLLSLDGPIDPAVRDLAAEIVADCRTSREKIDAVQRYFLANYTYHLGLHVPMRVDPVTYFLLQQPSAHCEYFASGTAILLRLASVPCRYVVGYVATEWNSVGGFWVARNKDAHAWVEAYDDEQEAWVIVESTPAAGIPQPSPRGLVGQFSDSFRHRLSIWRMNLREYGIITVLVSVVSIIWSIPGLIIVLAILAVMLVRFRPQLFVRSPRERTPDHLKEMHRVLKRLDHDVNRHGLQRRDDETLSQFADRVRQSSADASWSRTTADCYTLYVDLRYQGRTGPDAVEQLRGAAAQIPTPKGTTSTG